MKSRFALPFLLVCVVAGAQAPAAPDASDMRLLRMPDIHGDRIVFVYGGNLWTVPAAGGEARRLTSHEGTESYPKFSPDGETIAFSGEYDGNTDVYVMPAIGGAPERITYHPGFDRVIDWQPGGEEIRFQSTRDLHNAQDLDLWTVPATGGLPARMVLPRGGLSSYSPDGKRIAYNRLTREQRTWKRYKGGWAQEIWIYDFDRNDTQQLTDWVGTDNFPMWHGDTIYFTSDREDGKLQIWAHDLATGRERRITNHKEYDVKYPSLGPGAIVYESGGWLYVLDLATEKSRRVQVALHDDHVNARETLKAVDDQILDADVAPDAKRAVFSARGDIFTVPAEHGRVWNLTNTPGIRERGVAWSPDGKWIAYFSDREDEYQLYIRQGDGKGEERRLTRALRSWPSGLSWSPDSKRLLFCNAAMVLFMVDAEDGKLTEVDRSVDAPITDYAWSPDGRWIAYAKNAVNGFSSIYLYDVDEQESHRVTTDLTDDEDPTFDPEGKYLYFASARHFNPTIGPYDLKPTFTHMDGLYMVLLQADAATPFAPKSDEVEVKEDEEKKDADEDEGEKKDADEDEGEKEDADEEKEADEEEKEETRIDLAGIEERIVPLAVEPGNYFGLQAGKGQLFYLSAPSRPGQPFSASLMVFVIEDEEAKTVLASANGYTLAAGGEKILYSANGGWGIIDAKPDQKPAEKPLRTGEMMARVDPHAEWAQMFRDGWRLERDFFYDPDLHQVNWDRMYERYSQLVPYVSHRRDLDYLLGEMIAELSCSHAYVRATGDYPEVDRMRSGLLGCDLVLDRKSGKYRIEKIYGERDWNGDTPPPLSMPGNEVHEGDYLLAIDGVPLSWPVNPYSLLENKVDVQVNLEVGPEPGGEDSREITVETIGSERELRYTAWVNANRRRVEELSGGKIGYIHLPNTAIGGMQEFTKGYYPQLLKEGLIIDERYNGGGWVPDFIMTILRQKLIHIWKPRYGQDGRVPGTTFLGHLAMLTNETAGSGGDALPYYFKQYELGPVIGKRSWGGLVGYSRRIPLMDGGWLTFPEFGIVSLDGEFVVENHGVDPTIPVDNLPHEVIAGRDPQLERAVDYLLQKIEEEPVVVPKAGRFPRDRN